MAGREAHPRLRSAVDLPRQGESSSEGGHASTGKGRSCGSSKDVTARDKRLADVAAWIFNISTSVGVIMVNKQLLSVYGFGFATTLTGFHFMMTTLVTFILKWAGYIEKSNLPLTDLIKFAIYANFSIVGMNVSLMWNSVGFYQIAKLAMIPVTCVLEMAFDKIHYSRGTKLSILLVLVGVAICTVSDISINSKGFIAACVAVWSTSLQQYYVHNLQQKYKLGSFDLLGHTAPVQAASLIIVGPVVDYWLNGIKVHLFNYTVPSAFFIVLSCCIAVGTNLSQFICIGRFSAVGFQVLGHMKTVLVLVTGYFLFEKDNFTPQGVSGMLLAIGGMIWYGNVSKKDKISPAKDKVAPAKDRGTPPAEESSSSSSKEGTKDAAEQV